MNSYSVILTAQAARELEAAADWWMVHRSVRQAARWYEGISAKIDSLRESPERLPFADENPDFAYDLRELHFGLGANPTHRVVYTIAREFVVVLTIRHAAQQVIHPDDIETDPTSFGISTDNP